MNETTEPLDVSVVLPTYNEAQNLPVLVPQILAELQRNGIRGEVIVVDDDSPDGTGSEVAPRLAAQYPVRLLLRKDVRGLATAVLEGFAASRATVCVVMDADGSHPPDKLGEMILPVLQGTADMTVGSRNLPGGGSENWPWHRRLVSGAAALLARRLSRLSDPTSGFMAIRRDLLDGLQLNPIGYKIVLEIAVKAGGANLREIPIVFHDRRRGKSKLGLGEQIRYLRHLSRLYDFKYPSAAEFLRFCLVGFSGLIVDMLAVVALRELSGLDTRACAVVGFLAAVTSNYFLNRYWTFRFARGVPLFSSYFKFVAVCSIGLVARLLVMHALIEFFLLDRGGWYVLTNFIGILTATVINFAGAKFLALSPKKLAFSKFKKQKPELKE